MAWLSSPFVKRLMVAIMLTVLLLMYQRESEQRSPYVLVKISTLSAQVRPATAPLPRFRIFNPLQTK